MPRRTAPITLDPTITIDQEFLFIRYGGVASVGVWMDCLVVWVIVNDDPVSAQVRALGAAERRVAFCVTKNDGPAPSEQTHSHVGSTLYKGDIYHVWVNNWGNI